MEPNQTTDAGIDIYLPAVVQPSSEPSFLERLLTGPFRRYRAARLASE